MSPAAVESPPRRFSLFHLALVVPWVALVIDAFAPIRDNSFLWHIRAGELQTSSIQVFTTDPFSFTVHGERWLTQSWLAELLYSWGESHWALGFVPPMILLFSSVTFLGIGLVTYRRSRSVPAVALVLLLTTVSMLSFLVPRPVLLSFALMVLLIVAWERPSVRWTVPLLLWIWAAVHGSFVIGHAYLGLSLLSKKDWRALPTAFASGLATLFTAHGLGVVTMLLEFSKSGDALAQLTEWRRPELLSWVFTPFLVGALILVYGGYRERIKTSDAWLVVPFLVLAFGATRAIPPALLAMIPLIATSLSGARKQSAGRFSGLSASVFAAVVLILPFFLVSSSQLDETRFPIAAAEHLENVPTFHDDVAGGYLIWDRGPEFQVYLDDRAELYGNRLNEFVALRDGNLDWKPVFRRDGIRQVLLRADWELVAAIEGAGWARVYENSDYVILRP